MKKFITAIAVALVAASAFAQSANWIGNSYIVANGDWYNGSGEGNPAFNNADLGEIFSLTLAGQIQSYGDNSASENPAFINYSIVDTEISGNGELTWYTYKAENNWFESSNPIMIDISGLADGNYQLAVWFNKPTDNTQAPDYWGGNIYDSNDGDNYVASFTKVAAPVPEPATMSLLGLGALAMVIRRKLRK